ncbi:hypothetical protein KAI87_12210, partial [Myxococcota bacterium]|nr:hypothetical protein [Myxococcota bacterium]
MKTTQRGHLVQGFENLLASVATLAFNNPLRALALALVMTTAGIYSARNLGLDADLSELLPKTFPSVEGLEELKKRFGGIGFVVVVG